jgi:hypothetical protein
MESSSAKQGNNNKMTGTIGEKSSFVLKRLLAYNRTAVIINCGSTVVKEKTTVIQELIEFQAVHRKELIAFLLLACWPVESTLTTL